MGRENTTKNSAPHLMLRLVVPVWTSLFLFILGGSNNNNGGHYLSPLDRTVQFARCFQIHLTSDEAETQRSYISCLRLYSLKEAELRLEGRTSDSGC